MNGAGQDAPCRACPPGGDPRPAIQAQIDAELLRLAERHPQDLTSDEVRLQRLERCNACERLATDGTCLLCGCYVRFRASLRKVTCPYPRSPKW